MLKEAGHFVDSKYVEELPSVPTHSYHIVMLGSTLPFENWFGGQFPTNYAKQLKCLFDFIKRNPNTQVWKTYSDSRIIDNIDVKGAMEARKGKGQYAEENWRDYCSIFGEDYEFPVYETHFLSQFKEPIGEVRNRHWAYFPINLFPLFTKDFVMQGYGDLPDAYRTYDLVYYGTKRGDRKKNLCKFYKNAKASGLSVHFAGNNTLDKFYGIDVSDKCLGSLDFNELYKFLQRHKYMVVTSDDDNFAQVNMPSRVAEASVNGVISFIDNNFDPEHTWFNDDFFYVKDDKELYDKIKHLNANPELRKEYAAKQLQSLKDMFYNADYSKIFGEEMFQVEESTQTSAPEADGDLLLF